MKSVKLNGSKVPQSGRRTIRIKAHADEIKLQIIRDPIAAAFAPKTRPFGPAKGCNFGRYDAGVGAHNAIFQRLGHFVDAGQIASEKVRGEAEDRVVCGAGSPVLLCDIGCVNCCRNLRTVDIGHFSNHISACGVCHFEGAAYQKGRVLLKTGKIGFGIKHLAVPLVSYAVVRYELSRFEGQQP